MGFRSFRVASVVVAAAGFAPLLRSSSFGDVIMVMLATWRAFAPLLLLFAERKRIHVSIGENTGFLCVCVLLSMATRTIYPSTQATHSPIIMCGGRGAIS